MNPDEERNCKQNVTKRLFLARLVAACVCSLGITGLAGVEPSISGTLEASCRNPLDLARIWVYWCRLNGNITREGITADLEAMKRAGVGGVLIMEVDQGTPVGPLAFMSDRWRELFKHMVAEVHRLGIKVTMNNDAGWTGPCSPPDCWAR